MKIKIMTRITLATKKLYRVFKIIKIEEDISDLINALPFRVVVILLLLPFLLLYPEELKNAVELISPII